MIESKYMQTGLLMLPLENATSTISQDTPPIQQSAHQYTISGSEISIIERQSAEIATVPFWG